MNFATLYQRTILLEAGSNWAIVPNAPAVYALSKRAAKTLKKNPALARSFEDAMSLKTGAWEKNRKGRSWEFIHNKYANDRLNVPRTVKVAAFNIGGVNSSRSLGYIDENNEYQILEVLTHEEYNKYVKA